LKKQKGVMILLAAGSGKRMQSNTPKQFMELAGKQIICYCLDTIEKSEIVDECILVTSKQDIDYMREKVVIPGNYTKVKAICAGGAERFLSVGNGINAWLQLCEEKGEKPTNEILFVQDGARMFLSESIMQDTFREAVEHGACVAAVPSKDTIRISDDEGMAQMTPKRSNVWVIQTPQVFQWKILAEAYEELYQQLEKDPDLASHITDDACVVELVTKRKIKMVPADYENIKITTPEDLVIAESLLKSIRK